MEKIVMMRILSDYAIHKKNNSNYRLNTFIHFILWVSLVIVISKNILWPVLNTVNQSAFWYNGNDIVVPDFPWIFNFTKTFWLGSLPQDVSIYSVENHLHGTIAWLGTEVNQSLSFGYSPTMLFLLAPLTIFSHAVAFCIFNVFSLLAFWWQTRPVRCRFGVGMLALMSPVAMLCFHMGQTALLTGAGLLFLAERSRKGFERVVSIQSALCAGVLWSLTAKPPLALTAVVVLLALRQWQPVLLAALLVLATTLAISPYLGPGWITDYLNLISNYDRVQSDPAFMSGFATAHMANLRGVLSVDFNLLDNVASRVSSATWMIVLLGFAVAGHRLRLTVGGFWSIGLLLYLLFCPHVSSTEVLQVVLLLPFCIPAKESILLNWKELVLLFAIPLLPFVSPLVLDNRMILFCSLLCTLGFVMFITRENEFNPKVKAS
jgi:hypothetical protein